MSILPTGLGPFVPGNGSGSSSGETDSSSGSGATSGASNAGDSGTSTSSSGSTGSAASTGQTETAKAVGASDQAGDTGRTAERLFQARLEAELGQPVDPPARLEPLVLSEADAREMAEDLRRSIADNLLLQKLMAPPPIGANYGAEQSADPADGSPLTASLGGEPPDTAS